jgi:DHA2 family multidrug resistance protein
MSLWPSQLAIWEWFREELIIDVRLFKNFNDLSANLLMFIFGNLLFSSLVMMPQFLHTVLGYTAEAAGLVLSAGVIVLLLAMLDTASVLRITERIPAFSSQGRRRLARLSLCPRGGEGAPPEVSWEK